MDEEDVEAAYRVLASHFDTTPEYIQTILEDHFWSSSTAGLQPMQAEHEQAEATVAGTSEWTLDDLRAFLERIDALRSQGLLPPLTREVTQAWLKRDSKGQYYVASDEQLQQELELQQRMGIDPEGNLWQDGKLVKEHWLQSFEKHE